MTKVSHPQTDKLYRQILDTLEELNLAIAEEDEAEEDEDADESETQVDMVDLLTEEAGDRGLDEEAVERVLKAVAAFEKKVRDA